MDKLDAKQETVVLSAGTLKSDKIFNLAGDELGKVEELMIDIHEGMVSYAVLSFGGFMGLGNKLFAIPWSLLEVDTEAHCLRLDLNPEVLEKAPGFDKDSWPQVVTHDWLAVVYAHYDVPPYWL